MKGKKKNIKKTSKEAVEDIPIVTLSEATPEPETPTVVAAPDTVEEEVSEPVDAKERKPAKTGGTELTEKLVEAGTTSTKKKKNNKKEVKQDKADEEISEEGSVQEKQEDEMKEKTEVDKDVIMEKQDTEENVGSESESDEATESEEIIEEKQDKPEVSSGLKKQDSKEKEGSNIDIQMDGEQPLEIVEELEQIVMIKSGNMSEEEKEVDTKEAAQEYTKHTGEIKDIIIHVVVLSFDTC